LSKFYICAIEDGAGKPPYAACMVRTKQELDDFAARHDAPGKSVYWCPNPLRDDAETRSLDTLERLTLSGGIATRAPLTQPKIKSTRNFSTSPKSRPTFAIRVEGVI
jgi:hypothetical protein